MRNTVKARKAALLAGLCIPLSLTGERMAVAAVVPPVTIVMTVTIVAPPCVINDNQAITVEFGDVMTTRVDGSNYRMPVNYTLDCKDAPTTAMKLQVQGTGASFDGTLLQTSNAALGIQLQNGASPLPVNSWLNFTYPNKPPLWAVPVQQSGAALTGGEFTAVATMKVDYQ